MGNGFFSSPQVLKPEMFNRTYSREGRVPGLTSLASAGFQTGGSNVIEGHHVMPVEYPIRIIGYRVGITSGPSVDNIRLCVRNAHPTTSLPYQVISGTNSGWTTVAATAATVSGSNNYVVILLAASVKIEVPDLHYISTLVRTSGTAGAFRASECREPYDACPGDMYSDTGVANAGYAAVNFADRDGTATGLARAVVAGAGAHAAIDWSFICERI